MQGPGATAVSQRSLMARPCVWPSTFGTVSAPDDRSFAVQWLACALPCRRFADALAGVCARLGQCGSLLLHRKGLPPLLLAGLPRTPKTCTLRKSGSVTLSRNWGHRLPGFSISPISSRRMAERIFSTAANAVDHPVERRVLPVDWIVRIHQVCSRHLIGARLAPPPQRSGSACWLSSSTEVRPDFASHPAASERLCSAVVAYHLEALPIPLGSTTTLFIHQRLLGPRNTTDRHISRCRRTSGSRKSSHCRRTCVSASVSASRK